MSGARTVSTMIYSHQHTDHIGSAFQVKNAFPNAEIIAHQITHDRLAPRRDPLRPLPTTTFRGTKTLSDFDLLLSDSLNGAHAEGNIAIYSRSRRTLMAVDVLFPGWMPFDRVAVSQYIPDWFAGYQVIKSFDWDVIVAGHVSRVGTRQDLDNAIAYNNDLIASANVGIASVTAAEGQRLAAESGVFDPTNRNYGNSWLLFRANYERATEGCVDDMTAKGWGTRLASFDVFIWSHCEAVTESQRID